MQKYGDFLGKLIIFVPAVVFMAAFSRWRGFRIGSLNPVRAVSRLKNTTRQAGQSSGGYNPFRDFTFEKQPEPPSREILSPRQPRPQNPNYNVVKEFFTSAASDIVRKKDYCYVKNLTRLDRRQVDSLMLSPVAFKVEKNSKEPQVLIMHTHATESYLPTADTPYDKAYAFRSTDTTENMVAVGKIMADTLNSRGYYTLQDTTLHDYPSYNGSYDKSRETVEYYLEKYPSIKVVLDVHRDRVERNGAIIAPTATINGAEYAQIMIISGRDNGYMNMPNYRENLKFATNVQNRLAKNYPGIARPILFDYRNYNQQLTTGSILVEVGTHGSGLQRAKNSRQAFALSLADYFDSM